MNRILFLLIFFCSAFTSQLSAQKPNVDLSEASHVDWQVLVSPEGEYKPGDVITISFKGHVHDEFWHLYSVQNSEMGYSPTYFELFEGEYKNVELVGGTQESVVPVSVWDDIMGDTVRYFGVHDVTFSQKIKVKAAGASMTGALKYQICIDEDHGGMCEFKHLELSWNLPVIAVGNVEENNGEKSSEVVSSSSEDQPDTSEGNVASKDSNDQGNQTEPLGSIDVKSLVKERKTENDLAGEIVISGKVVSAKTGTGGCADESFWLIFFKAFLFGFAAVLTPCVFPMIPLTVTFFTKQSKTKAKGVRNALLYGLFIVLIYTLLGTSVSVVFGADALYLMSINPWVNLAFFFMLFIFALSFLGMFEITLPASWVNKIDSQSDRGGIIGIFFMALTLAVVSFSCTGPLVGTALIDAAKGCVWGPVISMLGFSSALAIPFCIFAIFPGWLNSMPKSGGWLNSVKVVLGFLELALGLKFLSQTDLILKWHILDREIFLGAWIVIFALMGLYLLGKIKMPHDSPSDSISVPRMILALCTFWFVIYLVPGLWGAKLQFVSGILPPPNADIGVKVLGQKQMNEGTLNGKVCHLDDRKYFEIFEVKEHSGFCTFYDLEEGLEFARKENRPVFLDFTGHTCANCRQMEQEVWPMPEISKLLKEDVVMISLYVDEGTKLPEPETINGKKVREVGRKWLSIQKTLYGTIAQPYYSIVDHNLKPMIDPRAFNKDRMEYKDFLEKGVKRYHEVHGAAH